MSERFSKPRLAINRVYTRRGDKGETSLVGGPRVPKDHLRIACYGTVDELNAFVGAALVSTREAAVEHPALRPLAGSLLRVQHELFNLGALLATPPEQVYEGQARITPEAVARLEAEIDDQNAELPALRSFVLPSGSRLSVELHQCRTICRRAERLSVTLAREESVDPEVVEYLNRLSDALFVWSRWVDHSRGLPEALWDPNAAAVDDDG